MCARWSGTTGRIEQELEARGSEPLLFLGPKGHDVREPRESYKEDLLNMPTSVFSYTLISFWVPLVEPNQGSRRAWRPIGIVHMVRFPGHGARWRVGLEEPIKDIWPTGSLGFKVN